MKCYPFLLCAFAPLLLTGCGGGSNRAVISNPPPVSGVGNTSAVTLPVPVAAPAGSDFHPSNTGWVLDWFDEFDGAVLDASKWEAEESCWGGGNEERQCYTGRERNVEIVNGLLRLKAYPENYTGPQYPQGWPDGRGNQVTQAYTSGKVRTRTRADWTYGRFSARMKLPKGQGTWPAFWMLPSDNVYGNWASSGEIDIMEAVNLGEVCPECSGGFGENRTSGALHYGAVWPDNTFKVNHNTLSGGAGTIDDYHVYAVEWGEGRINWFVDGEKFYTLNAEDWFSGAVEKTQNANAPFDQNFYLMFNLAVGGGLSEDNNAMGFDASNFPAEVLIDWVRVYKCEYDNTSGRTCMDGESP